MWYFSGDEISADQGAQIRVGTTMVTREANIPLKPRHNMAKLRCNSSNPATPEPLSTFVQLNITCKYQYISPTLTYRSLGYERVYLPPYKVADTPFHVQGMILVVIAKVNYLFTQT